MHNLDSCPFCHDINATMESGPCTESQPGLFMAQVHCGHCGAAGPRYCAEDTLAFAEAQARQEWNRGSPKSPSWAERVQETATVSITFSLGALALSYFLYDQVHFTQILGYLLGAVLLRITTQLLILRRRNRARKANLDELLRLQAA